MEIRLDGELFFEDFFAINLFLLVLLQVPELHVPPKSKQDQNHCHRLEIKAVKTLLDDSLVTFYRHHFYYTFSLNKLTLEPFCPTGPGFPGGPTGPCRDDPHSVQI